MYANALHAIALCSRDFAHSEADKISAQYIETIRLELEQADIAVAQAMINRLAYDVREGRTVGGR